MSIRLESELMSWGWKQGAERFREFCGDVYHEMYGGRMTSEELFFHTQDAEHYAKTVKTKAKLPKEFPSSLVLRTLSNMRKRSALTPRTKAKRKPR